VPAILNASRAWEPRTLLLLGSAASGEVHGRRSGGIWELYSDLDLGLFVATVPPVDGRAQLRHALDQALAGIWASLGLRPNPLDVGVFHLGSLGAMPCTIELAAAAAEPCALWGDPALVAQALGPYDAPYEALRLVLNRVNETLLPAGEPARLLPGVGGARDWPERPERGDWQAAHRWSKLPLDAVKAWGIARGAPAPIAALPGARAVWQSWGAWRQEPTWPPPPRAEAETSAAIGALLERLGEQLLDRPWAWVEPSDWLALLRREAGTARARWRRWRRLLANAPPELSRLRLMRWGWQHRAVWPASLVALITAGASLDIVRGERGAQWTRVLARRWPVCHDLESREWDAAWVAALERGLAWVRRCGA